MFLLRLTYLFERSELAEGFVSGPIHKWRSHTSLSHKIALWPSVNNNVQEK